MCGSRKYLSPHGESLEIAGEGGVRREIFFQGVQEQCPKETYRDRICNLVDQQIHELQCISVYSNAIRTFSGHL